MDCFSENSSMSGDSVDNFQETPLKLTGYYGISTILLEQIYEDFFQSERYDEQLRQEVMEKVIK